MQCTLVANGKLDGKLHQQLLRFTMHLKQSAPSGFLEQGGMVTHTNTLNNQVTLILGCRVRG